MYIVSDQETHPQSQRIVTCCCLPSLCSALAGSKCHADWASVEPLTYLEPFLEVIRSPETSGPITGVALTSVRRLLRDYTFGEFSAAGADLLHVIAMVQDT